MEWIFHIGIAQSIFAAFLLFTKKGNNLTDKILGVWMIFITLELIHMLLDIVGSPAHAFTSNFAFYSLTFGPFLYLYVTKLTQENATFSLNDLIHFLPYAIFSLTHLIFFTNRPLLSSQFEVDQGWFILNMLRVITLFISLSMYSLFSIRAIRKHKKSIKDSFSFESSNITLSWLKQVTFIFIATYLVLIINTLAGNIAQDVMSTSHYIPAFGLTFFCFSLSYYGFNQPLIFTHTQQKTQLQDSDLPGSLTSEMRAKYLAKLIEHMDTEKPFLNSELTINLLADKLKLPRHYITEILKLDLNKSFFALVNDYRVEEVKERLVSDTYKDESVLQVALASGFNSKSSFNSLFKQHTGMTPSQYRLTYI